MKIIYWTITWFGLDILSKVVCFHYTGLESCAVFSEDVVGFSALIFLGIWIYGCWYFSKD